MLLLVSFSAAAQTPVKPAAKTAAAHKANELTLAGLRPGRDTATRATNLYKAWLAVKAGQEGQLAWRDGCRGQELILDLDAPSKIQTIRVSVGAAVGDCEIRGPTPWKTGRGLRVGDPTERAVELYGEPDSRSPSTKDSQPLELLYYAFDWAGPNVPQVLEVLCTVEKDGKPGRVVEITLAAPSL